MRAVNRRDFIRLSAVNQVESGFIEGLSAVPYGRITLKDDIVQQSSFHHYRFCRMRDTLDIDVHFIPSDDAPR